MNNLPSAPVKIKVSQDKIFIGLGLCVLLSIHFLILKTITFTAWPEMFSYPYLINKGFLIYKDFAHPYVPLLSLILSCYYKITGLSLISNQLFTWNLILINDVLIFFIAKKFLKNLYILAPVSIYILLQPIFEGNMLWFDLATTPFILTSFLCLLYIQNSPKKFFWFGFSLSLALLTKQQSVVLILPIALLLIVDKKIRKFWGYFISGLTVPASCIFLLLLTQGILKEYFFWTLEFPLIWLPSFPGYAELPGLKNTLILTTLFGLSSFFLIKNILKTDFFEKIILISIIGTVIMSFPRFSYFHLQPAIATLAVFSVVVLRKNPKMAILLLTPVIATGLLLWKDYRPFIGVEKARFYDKQDISLANFVSQNSRPDEAVYFLGPHSLVFVMADRIPPKPWIENFVWHFEIPGMQKNQISGFEKEKSTVIFRQGPISGSWYDLGTYQPKEITSYIENNFEMTAKNESGIEVWKRRQ